jgi:hypothetical protein
MNLVLYYEVRLEKYLTKIFNGSISVSHDESIEKIIELYTNVLKAKNIKPSEWGNLADKTRQTSPGFMQFIQVDHLLEMAKQAIAVLDPEHPAFEILKNGLEGHASKISELNRPV